MRENYDNVLTNCIINNITNLVNAQDQYALDYTCTYSNFYNDGFGSIAGTGNFTGDPLFKDFVNGDFHLRPTSPCIDAGTTIATLFYDDDYLTRPQNFGYDVGAYEYSGDLAYFKLNENTGTMVVDAMGNLISGTISGASWMTGKSGYALNFDGTNDYASLGNPAALNMTGSRSIAAWIKLNGLTGTYQVIAGKYLNNYSLSVDSSGHLLSFVAKTSGFNADAAISQSNGTIAIGSWQHVAMTFDINGDKKIHLYINGAEVTYSTQSTLNATLSATDTRIFSIGCDLGSRFWFYGIIDEVKVYDRALSATEVNKIIKPINQ